MSRSQEDHMTEQQSTEQSQQQQQQNLEQPPSTEETASSESNAPGEQGEQQATQMSLEDAMKALSGARREAAGYRTQLRDAQKRLEDAKTAEDIEQAVQETTSKFVEHERSLLVENAALKFNLPSSLAERLKGDTREELEADAKSLAELIPSVDEDGYVTPRGGLAPGNTAEEVDPEELYRKNSRRQYSPLG